MTKAGGGTPPLQPNLEALVVGEVRRQMELLVKPHALGPDDALFMAYMAGYMAAMHANKSGDAHALEIFNRARAQVEKLRPFVAAAEGGS